MHLLPVTLIHVLVIYLVDSYLEIVFVYVDLSGLAVNIITSFSDDFVRNLISDALQEAAYVMTETRCRRMRLERQRQQNLTRTLEQSSQINVGRAMQHSNSFISNVKRFNSIGSNTLPFQRNSISRINRSLPDVRRDSARRSSLHSLPTTIIHGKGNLRRNSSSNVQRRRVERLHRCDARQFSEADEDSQCSAPDVDKLCLVVLQENGNGDSDNNSNNKVSDGCILDQSHNSSLVANGFASAASDIQLSPAKEVAACSNNHLGIVPNKNVDGQQYKILQSRLLTKPNAHLLNNLCLTTKSNAACHSSLLTSSCYHGNVSAVQNACNEARETDSICNLKSTDVCQINGSLSDSLCLNLHSDLATVKLSNLCQKRIDQMASNILNDAVENAVLVMRKGFETVACSLPNKDNCIPHELLIYSRTSDIVNYINSTALEIMNNAIAEAVDTICHCNFLQHNNALVETDVTESVQQLADDFVCHVMQDAVNKVTNDQMSARLHAQMSLEEIRDDWVRPLNNMQRSLAFFDVEFGGGNFIAALSPRASMSSSILEMNRRHNSVDEWQRGHRRSSSSSGSSGSSRRSTVLLDFEDELRRSGSIVEHCRAGHDLDEFRRYLSERAGEYSESKPKLTVRSNSSAQQSDSFTPLIMQSSTSSKSDNSHLSGAENNSAHKIEKQVTSYAKSKLHWFSWDLVIEAFRSALPLITSRTEQSSCIVSRCDSLPDHVMQQNKYIVKEEKSASESVVPKIFENFNEKPLPSENKLLASAQTIANQLCSNIFMDAIQNVSCHASQDCLSNSEQCENVSEMLNPFAEDIANQIINDAMHWATAATKKCLVSNSY